VSLTLFIATHVNILTSDHSTGSLTRRLHSQNIASVMSEDTKEAAFYITERSATMHIVHPQLRLMA
jgi:hypothetical protein